MSAALLAVLLCAEIAWAQSTLVVMVTRAGTGEPVSGARVEVVNERTGIRGETVTDASGHARFPALATGGPYTVTAFGSGGLETRSATGVSLRANFDRSVRLALERLPEFSDGISVVAERQVVAPNTVNAEVSASLAAPDLERLPVEGRDLTRALYRLPNVSQATGFYPEAPNVAINGANALYTSYLMDGLGNNENFLGGQKLAVPVGLVEDVTVLTGTFSAEFGRTGNGIFNVTTKSGSNQLRGELFYLTRPGPSLDASSPFAGRDLTGNPVRDGFSRDQLGLSLGGPFRRDRTFYFVNVEGARDDKDNLLRSPRLGINATVAGTNEYLYASGKVDHRFSDRLLGTVRLNLGDVSIERQGGGLDGGVTFPEAGSVQDRESLLAAASVDWVGESLYNRLSVQLSRFDWNYSRPQVSGLPQATVLGADGTTVAVLGNPGFTFHDIEETYEVSNSLELMRGDHTLKLGAEAVSSDFQLTGGGSTTGAYLVQLTEAQEEELAGLGRGADLSVNDLPEDVEVLRYDVELRPTSFGERQTVTSLYAEDQWVATPRLTVGLGLRWDRDTLSEGGSDSTDDNNLAPRLSLNYQLDDDSVLQAGFGVFYDTVLYAIYSDALQQNSTSAGFRWQLEQLIALGILPADTDLDEVMFDGNLVASFGDVAFGEGPLPGDLMGARQSVISNERRILSPWGYDNPVTEQYSLGYERRLNEDMLLQVDLLHTRAYNLPRLYNLNAPAPYPLDDPDDVEVRTPEEADASRPVPIVPGGARSILITQMAGEARYRAATVTLNKDLGNAPYAFRISYTLSRLENNTDDINFRAQDANSYAAEWGPSINDRTHVVSGFVQLFPLDGLAVTLTALVQSGQPINRIPDATRWGTTDLNGDGRSFGDAYVGNSDRWPGADRNSDRLPWSEVWDLSVAYRFPVGAGELELSAEVFNLFNETNLSGYANNATQSNQIQVGPPGAEILERNAGPARQFQLGVRYVF